MWNFGKALDEIRVEKAKLPRCDGYEPILKSSRWCMLKRSSNLTER
jgi:hypothetical protein